jgi:hypothetical protein
MPKCFTSTVVEKRAMATCIETTSIWHVFESWMRPLLDTRHPVDGGLTRISVRTCASSRTLRRFHPSERHFSSVHRGDLWLGPLPGIHNRAPKKKKNSKSDQACASFAGESVVMLEKASRLTRLRQDSKKDSNHVWSWPLQNACNCVFALGA